MKRRGLLVLAGAAMAAIACAPKTPRPPPDVKAFPTVDALAEAIVDALRRDDRTTFERALATERDLAWLSKRTPLPYDDDGGTAGVLRADREDARASWAEVRTQAAAAGVDWKAVTIDRIDYGIGTSSRVEGADVLVILRANDVLWHLRLDDCMRTKRGWILGDNMRWLPPSP